jgi:rubredoxin
VHDEATEGKWDELPADFECPECGVGKDEYETI